MSRHGIGVRDVLGRDVVNGDILVVHDITCAQSNVTVKLLFDDMLYAQEWSGTLDLHKTQYTLYVYRVDDIDQGIREQLLTKAQQELTIPVGYVEQSLAMPGQVGHAMLRRNGLVDVYLGSGKTMTMPEMKAFTGHSYLRLKLGQVLDLRRMLANHSTPLALKGDELLLTCAAGELTYSMTNRPGELVTKHRPEKVYIADLGEVPGLLADTVTLTLRNDVYPGDPINTVFYRDKRQG